MRDGFTLMELLGIIVLLGVIILVAVPVLVQSNKNADINEKKEFNNIIQTACEACVQVESKNPDIKELINTYDKELLVPAKTLVDEGYLKSSIKVPDKAKTILDDNGNINIKNKDGQVTCTYITEG